MRRLESRKPFANGLESIFSLVICIGKEEDCQLMLLFLAKYSQSTLNTYQLILVCSDGRENRLREDKGTVHLVLNILHGAVE